MIELVSINFLIGISSINFKVDESPLIVGAKKTDDITRRSDQ